MVKLSDVVQMHQKTRLGTLTSLKYSKLFLWYQYVTLGVLRFSRLGVIFYFEGIMLSFEHLGGDLYMFVEMLNLLCLIDKLVHLLGAFIVHFLLESH